MRVLLALALLAVADAASRSMQWRKDQPIELAAPQKSMVGVPIKQRLKSDNGMAYYGTLHVGGVPQQSIYDTGSFDLVLASTCGKTEDSAAFAKQQKCCDAEKCPFATYMVGKSGKYEEDADQELKQIVYGSGPVTIRQGYDHVAIHDDATMALGKNVELHIATNKLPVMVIVDHQIDLFQKTQMQAIVGIGPGMYADRQSRMLYELDIKRYMICFKEQSGDDGYITWNDKDRSEEHQEWKKIPVPGKVFWAMETSDFKFSGTGASDVSLGCSPTCGAILDSGTSLITPPEEVITKLKEHLEASEIEDCSDISKFPTFSFKLGGEQFTLPPYAYLADCGVMDVSLRQRNLAFKPMPMNKAALSLLQHARKNGKEEPQVHSCVLLLGQPDQNEMSQWGPMVIFGMSLFRKYAVQFDMSKDLADVEQTDEKEATRFVRLAEAAPDCSGTLKGGRFRQIESLQKVDLSNLRVSPLQQRLSAQSRLPHEQRMRQGANPLKGSVLL